MDYVLLSPEEAAALLSLSAQEIVGLIESGELGGLKVAGHWRVPLKSITQMLAVGMKPQTARAIEQVFEDHATWQRVFGAHPEVTQQLEAGELPLDATHAEYLRRLFALTEPPAVAAAPSVALAGEVLRRVRTVLGTRAAIGFVLPDAARLAAEVGQPTEHAWATDVLAPIAARLVREDPAVADLGCFLAE